MLAPAFFTFMEDLKTKAENISSHVKEYIDTLIKLISTKITQQIVLQGSKIIAGIILTFFAVLALFFLSLALGFWLGDILHSRIFGFLAVGLFYVLLVLILLVLRNKTILPWLRNIIVRMIYD